VGLNPAAELLVFAALLFAQAADLDQVCYHVSPMIAHNTGVPIQSI
jgi:hypothetical protein